MRREDKEALVQRFIEEVWNRANMAVLDQCLAPTAVIRYAGGPAFERTNQDEYLRSAYILLRTALPDLHATIDSLSTDGDTVAARITLRGTHAGTVRGINPTGQSVTSTGIDRYRIADGKIVDIQTERDYWSLLKPLIGRDYQLLYGLAGNRRERMSLWQFFQASRGVPAGSAFHSAEDPVIDLRGARYAVGPGTGEILVFIEVYHHRAYDRMADFIPQPGWTVCDVGANIGIFAILQAQRGAHVYAFEPNPACYRRLSRNVTLNGLQDKMHISDLAIGSASGRGHLHVPRGVTITGTITPTAAPAPGDGVAVAMTSLDDIMPSLGLTRLELLKIDVEGAEADVLRGATQTLDLVERIILEYHSDGHLEQVRRLLDAHGFTEVLQESYEVRTGLGALYARKRL